MGGAQQGQQATAQSTGVPSQQAPTPIGVSATSAAPVPGSGSNAVGAPPQQQFSRPADFNPSQVTQQVNFLFISESS